MLISNPLKKFLKNGNKKVISKISLTIMSKSGKSAHFHHFFANNFFGYIVFKLFKRIEISAKFYGF
jgi:hypothetical protein